MCCVCDMCTCAVCVICVICVCMCVVWGLCMSVVCVYVYVCGVWCARMVCEVRHASGSSSGCKSLGGRTGMKPPRASLYRGLGLGAGLRRTGP